MITSFEEVVEKAQEILDKSIEIGGSKIRVGQAYFTALQILDPELAIAAVEAGKSIDPYYQTENLDNFAVFVAGYLACRYNH